MALILSAGAGHHYHFNIPVIFLFLLLYFLMNLRRPITLSYVSDHIPSTVMATGLSIETQLKKIIGAFTAPLLGFLADRFGLGIGLGSVALLGLIVFPLLHLKSGHVKTT